MSYDMVGGFSPVTLIERSVFIVAVHPSVPARSIKELIALAKARPVELDYGSGGVGSAIHPKNGVRSVRLRRFVRSRWQADSASRA
jgi:tripartite-type tricarboxylate transporter receptor subunit TctC